MTIESLPILYSFRRCPYAMRARLAIAAAGLQVQLREVVLRNKPAHLLEISPKGTVPVLMVSEHTVIEQSIDIMYWALEQSDPEQLLPSNRVELVGLIEANDGSFKTHLDRYKYPPRYTEEHNGLSADAFVALHRQKGAQHLMDLEHRLAQHDFLLGSTLSMADLALAPFVRQFAHTDLDWFKAQDWPHLWQWLQRFLSSKRFAQIMHKYPPWQEHGQPTLFPPCQN